MAMDEELCSSLARGDVTFLLKTLLLRTDRTNAFILGQQSTKVFSDEHSIVKGTEQKLSTQGNS